jgi:hypothetical protein
MVKIVTTQRISQTTEIICKDFRERDFIFGKLKRYKKYEQKDGLFGIGGDYNIGVRIIDGESFYILLIYSNKDTKKHDEIVNKVTQWLIEKGNYVSRESNIEYINEICQ